MRERSTGTRQARRRSPPRPGASPAELQGLLCGAVCADGRAPPTTRLARSLVHRPRVGKDFAPARDATPLLEFRDRVLAGLDDETLAFPLLLPDDDAPLASDRLDGAWRSRGGFLSGFGLSGGNDRRPRRGRRRASSRTWRPSPTSIRTRRPRRGSPRARSLEVSSEHVRMGALSAARRRARARAVDARPIATRRARPLNHAEDRLRVRIRAPARGAHARVGDDATVLVPAAAERYRNKIDAAYPYRPELGLPSTDGRRRAHEALLVLAPGRPAAEQIKFCRDLRWSAPSATTALASVRTRCQMLQLDDAFPIGDVDEIVPRLLEGRRRASISPSAPIRTFDRRVMNWVNELARASAQMAMAAIEFVDIGHLLHDMRLVKSARSMRADARSCADLAAAECARRAMEAAPRMTRRARGRRLFAFRESRPTASRAYESSSPAASERLHVTTSATISDLGADGELVLIDAGASSAAMPRTSRAPSRVQAPSRPSQRRALRPRARARAAPSTTVRDRRYLAVQCAARSRRAMLTSGSSSSACSRGELDALLEVEASSPWTVHKSSHGSASTCTTSATRRLGDALAGSRAGHGADHRARPLFPADLDSPSGATPASACASRTTCWSPRTAARCSRCTDVPRRAARSRRGSMADARHAACARGGA